VLLADRAGGNGQLLSLAEALGWPCERKTITYNAANRLPNLLLGASLASVRAGASSALAPPWPDLVLAASRRSVPVARWIRGRSGGRTKLVHLLHAMAPLDLFDLVITTPQYRLPARPNVLHLAAPLNRIAAAALRDAAARWSPRLAHLPRPFVALLVSTSPRTVPAAADALAAALAPASFVYRWRPGDADNPYHAFLALADRFIVTADSASQLVEAVTTGKPVDVFSWPPRRQPWPRDKADAHGAAAGLVGRLVDWGLLKPPRDFAALHRALQARGLIDSAPGAVQCQPLDDMEQAVAAIRRLFAPTH